MKKIKIILSCIIIVLFFAAFGLYTIISNNTEIKKAETIRNIKFEPYSNQQNMMILVTIEDSEYNIKTIKYLDKNGKEKIINTSKNKVSLDYEVINDGNYKFQAENENGDIFENTLIVDFEYRKLIDIQIEPKANTELVTEVGVTIDYDESILNINNIKKQYKIGNTKKWLDYEEKFNISSYYILENLLQEEDNKTVTIYAKSEDLAKIQLR